MLVFLVDAAGGGAPVGDHLPADLQARFDAIAGEAVQQVTRTAGQCMLL
jgi:hypothetical protein